MNKRKILSAAIASVLVSGLAVSSIPASYAMSKTGSAAQKEHVAKKSDKKQDKMANEDLLKVSQDALISLRDVRSARFAIYNGEPDRAQTFVDAAKTRIEVADKEADKYALDIKAAKSKDMYVPYDATLTIEDTFKPTAENAKSIAKANQHLHKGEQKKALETLKISNIDVAISTGLIPVKFARENIEKASSLVREGKYYQANLALKQVDDAIIYQSYGVDDIPKAKVDGKSHKKTG